MTHAEKLQLLFEAALKDSSEPLKPLTRSFPSTLSATTAAASPPAPEPKPERVPVVEVPVAPIVEVPAPPVVEVPAAPVVNAGLSDVASAELGKLLDEQHQRKTSKHRRELLITLSVLFALTGGGFGWFVQSPQRVAAFKEAIRDVRSVGDVKSMVAKYQAALDKVAVRSNQIDQATASMGVSANQDDAKDPNMDAEMLAMMGGEGKTTGQRNQLVQEKFGSMKAKDEANAREADAQMTAENTFD